MSRKSRKYRRQRRFPTFWVLVIGGLLLVVAGAILLFRPGSGTATLAPIEVQGQAAIRVDQEGCWPPQLTIGSMVLQPGESTTIKSSVSMMHEGMGGPHNFAVHLITNDPVQPDMIVNVISNWIP